MSMRYRVTHQTTYAYAQPVSLCHSLFHLRLRSCAGQIAEPTVLAVSPSPAVLADHDDAFGNPTTVAIVQERHRTLTVTAETLVSRDVAAIDASDDTPWERVRDALAAGSVPAWLDPLQMTLPSPLVRPTPALRDYAHTEFLPDRPFREAAIALSARLHRQLAYIPGATTVDTTPDETLAAGRGVCQDFAHVFIGCLRSLGLPARYVSGYLVTTPADAAHEAALVGADASHAWVAFWSPGLGWTDVDPTNDVLPSDRHVTVAWGRDFGDVCPVKGVVLGGGAHTIEVGVQVTPIASTSAA